MRAQEIWMVRQLTIPNVCILNKSCKWRGDRRRYNNFHQIGSWWTAQHWWWRSWLLSSFPTKNPQNSYVDYCAWNKHFVSLLLSRVTDTFMIPACAMFAVFLNALEASLIEWFARDDESWSCINLVQRSAFVRRSPAHRARKKKISMNEPD